MLYFERAMPRLNVSARKRVIILRRQGYALKDIRRRLGEKGIVVSMRTLQRVHRDRLARVSRLLQLMH